MIRTSSVLAPTQGEGVEPFKRPYSNSDLIEIEVLWGGPARGFVCRVISIFLCTRKP